VVQTIGAFIYSTGSGGGNGGGGGTVCNCLGNFKDPAIPIAAANPAGSPGGKYSVATHFDAPSNTVELTVSANGAVRLDTGALPITAAWGFSPDEDRFLFHYLSGPNNSIDNIFVYDLTFSPARVVVQTSPSVAGSRLQFSPSGRYFLLTTLLGQNTTEIDIYRVQGVNTSQNAFYTNTIHFAVGSGIDAFGAVDWGFSPDKPESSFVYAYVSGQSTVQWTLVNLLSGREVLTEPIDASTAFWQYDPCGDVIGLVTQVSQTQMQIDLIDTATGRFLPGSGGAFPSLSISLFTASVGHEIQYSGQTVVISPNTSCPSDALPQLAVTRTLSRDPGTNDIVVNVTIANSGGSTATNVQLTAARIGVTASTTALPLSFGAIAAGGSAQQTARFPGASGSPGANTTLTLGGTYTGAAFAVTARIQLP
jgi:hypothetical protein